MIGKTAGLPIARGKGGMTENITAMDEARFKELAASYGGDLAQWPRGTKASARLLLRQKPALVGTLAAVMEDQGTVKS